MNQGAEGLRPIPTRMGRVGLLLVNNSRKCGPGTLASREDDLDGAAGGNRATKRLRLAFFCFLLGSRPARWGKDLA